MCWSHHILIRNTHCYPDLPPLVSLDHLSLSFFLSFYAAPFFARYVWPTLKELVVVFYLLGEEYLLNYWDSSAREICFFSHLSIYPIYFYQQRFMEYIYITIYIVIIEYYILLAQTLSSLAIGSSFSWLQYPFGIVDVFFPFFLFSPSFPSSFLSLFWHNKMLQAHLMLFLPWS